MHLVQVIPDAVWLRVELGKRGHKKFQPVEGGCVPQLVQARVAASCGRSSL